MLFVIYLQTTIKERYVCVCAQGHTQCHFQGIEITEDLLGKTHLAGCKLPLQELACPQKALLASGSRLSAPPDSSSKYDAWGVWYLRGLLSNGNQDTSVMQAIHGLYTFLFNVSASVKGLWRACTC